MKGNESFNLIRWFGLLSAVCVLLLALGMGYTLSHFLTEKLLYREATLTQEFVDSIIQTDRIYDHFHPYDEKGLGAELRLFFQHLANMPDVVKAKAYDANMVLLWDSDTLKSGQHSIDNDELILSLEGNLVTEYGTSPTAIKKEHEDLTGTAQHISFIETYIPVWNSDYSKVLGSIEIYKQPRILHEAITQGSRLVWSISLIGAAVLFAVLFGIVWRANRTMQAQQARLVESESLSMIGETASAVAHAMRNALASIRASAELTLDDDLNGARESARDIMSESDRLNRWAGELLKFSGDDASSGQIIDLVAVLDDVIDEHRLVLSKARVELHNHYAEGRYRVRANAAQLSQVFGNLIMNAVEAMEDGGRLTVRLYLADIEARAVRVDVIDTGPGLSQDIIGQLFKPFATTKPNGTGLGLALTRRMLTRYDGSIVILSEPGQGVTARVDLPLFREQSA